jgi:DNA processing protein
LNWDIQKESKLYKTIVCYPLDDEQKVYDYLLKTGKELMDIIALRCEFPIKNAEYELKGVIRPLPGKLFEAI